jgi:hypothetical protein
LTGTGREVRGVVLCRVGTHRVAFPAVEVTAIERVPSGPSPFADARMLLSQPLVQGRVLIGDHGSAVVVNALEIHQDAVVLLTVPPLLGRTAGRSLGGFILLREELWPVLRLHEFSKFIQSWLSAGASS